MSNISGNYTILNVMWIVHLLLPTKRWYFEEKNDRETLKVMNKEGLNATDHRTVTIACNRLCIIGTWVDFRPSQKLYLSIRALLSFFHIFSHLKKNTSFFFTNLWQSSETTIHQRLDHSKIPQRHMTMTITQTVSYRASP